MSLSVKVPFTRGRLLWLPKDGNGSALRMADRRLGTHLKVEHHVRGRKVDELDCGSGLTTNIMQALNANDPLWAGAPTPFSAFAHMEYHTTGTGTTAEAQTDFGVQAIGTHFGSGTNGYTTGVLTAVAPNVLQSVGAITYNGAEAVSEWALYAGNIATINRTSTGAAPTSTTFTDAGATFPTAGNGLQGCVIEISVTGVNTPTTTVYGLITSNTATVLTIAGGWWTLANVAASTPGSTVSYTITPALADHKKLAGVLNVINGSILTFTYSLTLNAGG